MKKPIIFTIGHSTHSIDEFIELLHTYGIKEIVDVRSIPKSRHNPQFNTDADYMSTSEFEEGLQELTKIADTHSTAIMCAEAVPWRCHRSLIADALIKKGWLVRDVMSRTSVKKHLLTSFLKVRKGQIIYPIPKI